MTEPTERSKLEEAVQAAVREYEQKGRIVAGFAINRSEGLRVNALVLPLDPPLLPSVLTTMKKRLLGEAT